MKKQRGMTMFLSAALAGSQLLTAMSAWAEDGQPPARQTTTVQAELQKLVHQDQAQQSGTAPTAPEIELVQASGQQANAQQNLRQARKAVRDERRSNNIFRRLFTDNSQPKQIPGLGAPPPKIPNPPALIYRSVAGQMVQTGGTPGPRGATTMVVSSSAAPGGSKVPIVTSNARRVDGNAKVSTDVAPGFVNPFETNATAEEDPQDAMLDLDVLVAEEKAAVKKADELAAAAMAAIAAAEAADEEAAVAGDLPVEVASDSSPERPAEMADPIALPVVEVEDDGEAAGLVATVEKSAETSELEAVPLLNVAPSEIAQPAAEPAAEMTLAPADAAKSQDTDVAADAVVNEPVPQAVDSATKVVEATESVAEVDADAAAGVVADTAAAEPQLSAEEQRRLLASRARRDHQTYRIMARTGKTGFKGFCPVELRDNRELVDSRQEYKSRFGLQTYFFSSAEARAAFEKDPSRYAPAAGGSDVVLLVNTSEEEPGSLDFSLWYRDRLFLFRSRETQQLFSKNPARYANQY